MAEFIHRRCNKIVAMVIPLRLTVATLQTGSLEAFTPGAMDIRVLEADGTLKNIEAGASAAPSWYCNTCRRDVDISEVVATCFGCGEVHPINQLVANLHTSPTRMDCYTAYRKEHEEEQLPEKPKTRPLMDLIQSLPIKL